MNLYAAIGSPKVMIHNFWDIYLDLLRRLHDGSNEALHGILSDHQQSHVQPDQEVHLLPNMEQFRLGQPLNVGRGINYIGGLDILSSTPAPGPEYAYLTPDEDSSNDGGSGDDED